MVEAQNPTRQALRVVVISTLPQVVAGLDRMLGAQGHRIVGVVTTPGPERRRSTSYQELVRMVRPSIDILITTHPRRMAAMLAPLRPDLIVCMSFPFRIPEDVLNLPPLGVINGHPAFLPRYRGPNSVGWAIRNGDTEIGFTFHRMDGDFDTGPILAQATAPLAEDDDIDALFAKMGQLAFSLFPVALARVLQGDPGDPQTEDGASYAGLFEDAWKHIDWSQPAELIHRQVRSWIGAIDLAAGALAEIDGETIRVLKTRLLPGDSSAATPGTVLRRDAETGAFVIQCGDGPLEVTRTAPA